MAKPKVDADNRTKDGEYVGTEEAPQVETSNVEADPNSDNVLGSHRYGERAGGSKASVKLDDGRTATWNDPDAVPGTIGDSAEETVKAVAEAGLPAAKVSDK